MHSPETQVEKEEQIVCNKCNQKSRSMKTNHGISVEIITSWNSYIIKARDINKTQSVGMWYLRKAKAATLNHILSEYIKTELKYNKRTRKQTGQTIWVEWPLEENKNWFCSTKQNGVEIDE
jgi:hypothetical protein